MKDRKLERGLSLLSIFSLAILVLTGPAFAQDIFIYAAKGQSQAQQDKDRYECHSWGCGRIPPR